MYTQEAIDFLYNRSNSNNNDPWFLYYGFEQPHIPLFRSQGFKNISRRGVYGDTVQEMDYNIGKIYDTLIDTGFENNTLIIITSDNGAWINPNAGTIASSIRKTHNSVIRNKIYNIYPFFKF